MQESDSSDYDSDDFIEYDENSIPEVKLFHKFCRPLKESPLPVGKTSLRYCAREVSSMALNVISILSL